MKATTRSDSSALHGGRLIALAVDDDRAAAGQDAPVCAAWTGESLLDELERSAHDRLAAAREQCAAAGAAIATRVVHESAGRHDCDVIVLATSARTGAARVVLGSTAQAVVRMSDFPVLTVHAIATVDAVSPFGDRIVLAVDDWEPGGCGGSDCRHATGGMRAVVHRDGLRVIDESLSRAAFATAVERCVVEGRAAEAIVDTARDRHAGLIVVGGHGRRGLTRLLLGSVAEGVLRGCLLPVMIVRRRPVAPRPALAPSAT